jgi:hypothetical protein
VRPEDPRAIRHSDRTGEIMIDVLIELGVFAVGFLVGWVMGRS